ncbi:MAG: DUF371 domain-containing protein [Desulfurococcales archaeon]|nr:DUF371 domain-containing protein [Desulfurococcales archaeon]
MDGSPAYRIIGARWVKVTAWGHHNVKAAHRSTFEVTTDENLTPRGDCIVGVRSSTGAGGLPPWFREEARKPGAIIVAVLCSSGVCDSVAGRGDPGLEMSDPSRMIFRRSTYIEPATVMVRAGKAARDLDRRLVESLRRGARLDLYLTVIPPGDDYIPATEV